MPHQTRELKSSPTKGTFAYDEDKRMLIMRTTCVPAERHKKLQSLSTSSLSTSTVARKQLGLDMNAINELSRQRILAIKAERNSDQEKNMLQSLTKPPYLQPKTITKEAKANIEIIPKTRINAKKKSLNNSNSSCCGSKTQAKLKRPSLSEQLASIGANIDSVTENMKKGRAYLQSGNNDVVIRSRNTSASTDPSTLFSAPTRSFGVGNLISKYPTPVTFYKNRCEYEFYHPYENTVILMIMYYADLKNLSIQGYKIRFKVPRKLALFLADFDPNNPFHLIVIELASELSMDQFQQKVKPLIKGMRSKAED